MLKDIPPQRDLSLSSNDDLRPVDQTAFFRMIIWLVSDVAVIVQLPDTFMISSNGCDLAMRHQFPAGNRKWADKTVTLPLDKERGKQADMRCQKPVIATHAFEQPAMISKFLHRGFGIHFKPPSRSLFMSSCL